VDAETRKHLTDAARFGRKAPVSGRGGVAVTSHPLATRAATDMLRAGGNAVDAALAASVTQTVVEPHMTTLCGVLSMLHFDARSGETTYLNGSMARPAGLTSFGAADVGTARSVAVPGFWAGFEAALERHGSLPKKTVVSAAIDHAENGFEVHPFLSGLMFQQAASLGSSASTRRVFFRNGTLLEVGDVLRQQELAETLHRLVESGVEHFYRGDFAARVVETVQAAGGVLTRQDLEDYEVRWMEPARGTYRDFDVVGSPPPDRGGTHFIEILNLLELIPLRDWGPPTQSAESLYWMARFCGEVYVDGFALRDPRDYPVPLDLITSKDFAARRFELMKMSDPRGLAHAPYPGSCHVTVIDAEGTVATVIHSVMSMPWSTGLSVDGVQLWSGAAHFLGNLPKAGGRGSCYVAPTIVLKDQRPVLAAGSPSVGLLQNLVQNTVNILDFGMDVETSVSLPRFGGVTLGSYAGGGLSDPAYYCEADVDETLRQQVTDRGLQLEVVQPWDPNSGSYEGVHVVDGVAHACADPRRAGAAEAV